MLLIHPAAANEVVTVEWGEVENVQLREAVRLASLLPIIVATLLAVFWFGYRCGAARESRGMMVDKEVQCVLNSIDYDEVEKMTIQAVRSELRLRQADAQGTKEILVNRLIHFRIMAM